MLCEAFCNAICLCCWDISPFFFTGYFWYSLAMSFEFSMTQSLILRGRWWYLWYYYAYLPLLYLREQFPSTCWGFSTFLFKILEYYCFFDYLIILHTLFRKNLYCSSLKDVYLSRVLIAYIYTMHNKFSNFLCFTSFCAHLCAMPINFKFLIAMTRTVS